MSKKETERYAAPEPDTEDFTRTDDTPPPQPFEVQTEAERRKIVEELDYAGLKNAYDNLLGDVRYLGKKYGELVDEVKGCRESQARQEEKMAEVLAQSQENNKVLKKLLQEYAKDKVSDA